jgi:hypothetical protein
LLVLSWCGDAATAAMNPRARGVLPRGQPPGGGGARREARTAPANRLFHAFTVRRDTAPNAWSPCPTRAVQHGHGGLEALLCRWYTTQEITRRWPNVVVLLRGSVGVLVTTAARANPPDTDRMEVLRTGSPKVPRRARSQTGTWCPGHAGGLPGHPSPKTQQETSWHWQAGQDRPRAHRARSWRSARGTEAAEPAGRTGSSASRSTWRSRPPQVWSSGDSVVSVETLGDRHRDTRLGIRPRKEGAAGAHGIRRVENRIVLDDTPDG